jgi:hypothetical protein
MMFAGLLGLGNAYQLEVTGALVVEQKLRKWYKTDKVLQKEWMKVFCKTVAAAGHSLRQVDSEGAEISAEHKLNWEDGDGVFRVDWKEGMQLPPDVE